MGPGLPDWAGIAQSGNTDYNSPKHFLYSLVLIVGLLSCVAVSTGGGPLHAPPSVLRSVPVSPYIFNLNDIVL